MEAQITGATCVLTPPPPPPLGLDIKSERVSWQEQQQQRSGVGYSLIPSWARNMESSLCSTNRGMTWDVVSFSFLLSSLLSSRPVSTNTEQKSFNTSEKKNSSLSGGSSSHVFSKNYFSTPVDALAHDTTKTKTKTTTIYVYTSVNKYIDIRVCGLEKTTKLGGTTQHTHTQSVD